MAHDKGLLNKAPDIVNRLVFYRALAWSDYKLTPIELNSLWLPTHLVLNFRLCNLRCALIRTPFSERVTTVDSHSSCARSGKFA